MEAAEHQKSQEVARVQMEVQAVEDRITMVILLQEVPERRDRVIMEVQVAPVVTIILAVAVVALVQSEQMGRVLQQVVAVSVGQELPL